MRRAVLLAVFIASVSLSVSGATADRPSTTADRSTGRDEPERSTNLEPGSGASELTYTNRAGESFTVSELARSLESLRAAIDETMPALTAFNENFATNAGNQSVAGTISSILSGVLNRNTNNTDSAEQRSSSGETNLVTVLEGLLGGTAASSGQITQTTVQQLVRLQNQLQPVLPLLSALNVRGSERPGSEVIGRSPSAERDTDIPRTPTGRPQSPPPDDDASSTDEPL